MPDSNKYHNGSFNSNGFQHNGIDNPAALNSEPESEDEIDLKQLFYTLWNRKWLIIGTILLCGFLAGLIAYTSTPIYQSEGSMLIQDSQQAGIGGSLGESGIGQILSSSYGLGVGSTLANELQVLQSRHLSNLVADSLMKQPVMADGQMYPILFRSWPDDATITSSDTVAARLRNKIIFVQPDREAKVVDIRYESPSPKAAANIVNVTMQQYNELSTRQNRSGARSAVTFLEDERNRIENELHDSEEKLRKFMNRTNLVQVDAQTEELIKQIATLEGQREEARAKLQAANAGVKQYTQQLNGIRPGLAKQYADAVGPNLSRLQYQLAELQIQKTQLLTDNPNLKNAPTPPAKLQNLNRKIKEYQQRIENLTQKVLDQNEQYIGFLSGNGVAETVSQLNQKLIELKVQQNQYQAQAKILTGQIDDQQQYFQNLPDNIIQLARLKRDVKINEELYSAVSKQYAETALWEQTQFGKGRIIDAGYVPKEPVAPKKKLYLLAGLLLGGILSVGYVVVQDAFNVTIDSVEKMRELSVPLLSVIPTMNEYLEEQHHGKEWAEVQGQNISSGLITVLDAISPISESFRRLQNNIIYSNPDAKLNTIMITSSGKGEGKTTTIANLGVTLAEAGYNTALVDVDFRRPNLHNMFGLRQKPGLVDVLFDDVNLEEALEHSIVPGLDILSAGRKPPNTAAVSQSRAFLDLIDQLKQRYDYVLVDTAPIGIITDASAVIQKVDSVAVVAKFGATTETQLKQTLEQLRRLHANVTGMVLTAFDHRESSDYHLNSGYYKQVYKEYDNYKNEPS